MEDGGRALAILRRACPESLPGASSGQAVDCIQQLVHEAQLLLGTGLALGREGHMHSLAWHARDLPTQTPTLLGPLQRRGLGY